MVGQALVCVEARYASIRWKGAPRLDRRFVDAARWRPIERELRDGWTKGLVSPDSVVFVALLAERRSLQLQFMTSPPIEAEPLTASAVLDGYLNVQRFV